MYIPYTEHTAYLDALQGMAMSDKKNLILTIAITAMILASGCALDEIRELPTCFVGNDFSNEDNANLYSEEAHDIPDYFCPNVEDKYEYCYQHIKILNNYICTICPRGMYFCNDACQPTPCPLPTEKQECIYVNDFTMQDASEYQTPPDENSPCLQDTPKYPYCYSNTAQTNYLCSRCDKDSDTPRYCAATDTCTDTHCGNCSEIQVHLMIDGEETSLCALPIRTAEDFLEAAQKPNSSQNYILMNDIDLSDIAAYSGGTVTYWEGFRDFRGMFVAESPRQISIQAGEGSLSCGYANTCGLFITLKGATIHNLQLNYNMDHPGEAGLLTGSATDSVISRVEATGHLSGTGIRLGGLAGAITANTLITDSSFSGQIEAPEAQHIGGIVGESTNSTLKRVSTKSLSVTGRSEVGGIVGILDSKSSLSELTLAEDTSVTGENNVGGIVGHSQADLHHLTSKGTVTMVTPEYPMESYQAGGVVGYQEGGTLKDLTNMAHVTVTAPLSYTLTDSAATAIGGIAGQITGDASLNDLHNAGDITYLTPALQEMRKQFICPSQIGGIAGGIGESNRLTELDSAVNTGTIRAEHAHCAGGIVGKGTNMGIQNVSNTGAVVSAGNNIGGIAGLLMLDALPVNIPALTYTNFHNEGVITGQSNIGGIVGLAFSQNTRIPLTFSHIRNSGSILDIEQNVSTQQPHGGIFGTLAFKGREVTLTDLINTGEINVPNTTATGGLIGAWAPYVVNTSSPAEEMHFTLRRSFSETKIHGKDIVGGLIGMLLLDQSDQLAYQCRLDCFRAHTEMHMSDVYAEGTLSGNYAIGGLVGYLVSTPSVAACEVISDFIEPACDSYSRNAATFSLTSTLDIQNAYAAVDMSGQGGIAGMIGQLNAYRVPSETNRISIRNFYLTRYSSNIAIQSGLFCPQGVSLAAPDATQIYAAQGMFDTFGDIDLIASQNPVTTFHELLSDGELQLYVHERPLMDILNEHRGEHALWIDKVVSETTRHIPTLSLSNPDTP